MDREEHGLERLPPRRDLPSLRGVSIEALAEIIEFRLDAIVAFMWQCAHQAEDPIERAKIAKQIADIELHSAAARIQAVSKLAKYFLPRDSDTGMREPFVIRLEDVGSAVIRRPGNGKAKED